MSNCKLTDSQRIEICRLYSQEGIRSPKLALLFKVSQSTIKDCLKKNNVEINRELQINPGEKFGRLEIIKEVGKRNGNRFFLCECSCEGKTRREVALGSLRNGDTTSCGCYHLEKISERVDYIGRKFGKLTILEEININRISGQRRALASCDCDGNIKEYNLYSITNNHTKSCGCYNKEKVRERQTLQLKDYKEKHSLFCQVEEIRDCENEIGIEVKCKKCDEWFKPTRNQLKSRIKAIEKPDPKYLGAEANLYCSEKCKQECDVFGAQTIPKSLRSVKTQSRCNQHANRKALLDLQIDECGYNYCEKCGKEFKPKDLIIHHNIMVGKDHAMADDMSHQLLVCKEHHEHKDC